MKKKFLQDSARERTKKSKIMELLENAKKANALQESNEEIDDEVKKFKL